MTATPIPAGSGLTIDDDLSYTLTEASSQTPVYFLRFEGRPIACMTPVDRARLLAGPPRPDGVPDEAVPFTVWADRSTEYAWDDHGKHSWSDIYLPDGTGYDSWDADDLRKAGVSVPPYQPTPPQPEPTASSKETGLGVAPSTGKATNVALVTEARTGPLGLNDELEITDELLFRWVSDGPLDNASTTPAERRAIARRFVEITGARPVARWDAEDAAPQPDTTRRRSWPPKLTDMVADAMQQAWDEFCADTDCYPDCIQSEGRGRLSANFRRGNFAAMVASWIEAASRPDPGTITVNRDDLRAVVRFLGSQTDTRLGPYRQWVQLSDALAAAGLPQEPTEGAVQR